MEEGHIHVYLSRNLNLGPEIGLQQIPIWWLQLKIKNGNLEAILAP